MLTEIFSSAAGWAGSGIGLVTLGTAYWLAGPRQLKPTNTDAKVITARIFPNIFTVKKVAVKDGSVLYLKFGASKPTDVPLKVYSVKVEKEKGHALVLNDKMKIDVSVMFQVSIDDGSEPSAAKVAQQPGEAPKVPVKATDAIIKAVAALNGDFKEENVERVLEARFDSALRLAAANMGIEEINSHREKFIQQVKEGLKLDDVGFKLNEVSLRSLTPALLDAYDPSNSYDAEGMKKVVEIVQASARDRNTTEQEAKTQIALTDKDQELRRLTIAQQTTQARLEQEERVAQSTSDQARRVAEFQANNTKESRLVAIQAEQETAAREVSKDQELKLAGVNRDKTIALATQETLRSTREAEIKTQTAVETADRDKEIALALKNADAAKAQATANEARAEAVVAEEAVVTARDVAKAERTKQIDIISAETEAGKAAAGKRIDADATVYVAEQNAKAVKVEAQGIAEAAVIDARADAEAARLRADANYETLLQPLKAAAEGKTLDAEAQSKLNAAFNVLSDAARTQQVELARVQITPQVVEKMTAALGNVDKFTVLSGMPGTNGVGGGEAGASAGTSNVFNDVVKAIQQVMLTKPLLAQVLEQFGGDSKIANNLPGLGNVEVAPAAEAGNDNLNITETTPGRKSRAGGAAPAPQV